MSTVDDTPEVDAGTRLARLAEQVRALACAGLTYTKDSYDRERYEHLVGIAAELLSFADSRTLAEIDQLYRGDLVLRTPFLGADAAIFDETGRILLVQRNDGGHWCMPGGACDVGESPSTAAERETWEETGLRVEARRLMGVFDGFRLPNPAAVQIYHLLFQCEPVGGTLTTTNETTDYGWFTEEQARELTLYRGHVVKVPTAFRVHRGEVDGPVFH